MRRVVALAFVTLDGVMQAPGGPQEDVEGGFKYGGWLVPYFDERLGQIMAEQMRPPFALLLGRKTFEIFASYWPRREDEWPGVNAATKYVVSHEQRELPWRNSVLITGNVADGIRRLKAQDGPTIQVHGSSQLLQALFEHDLADELWLQIFPVTLGSGKRLFGSGTMPAAFSLERWEATPNGVIIANYAGAGEAKTGTVGA